MRELAYTAPRKIVSRHVPDARVGEGTDVLLRSAPTKNCESAPPPYAGAHESDPGCGDRA